MSDQNACCCIHYRTAGITASLLSLIVTLCCFLQLGIEENCTNDAWRIMLLVMTSLCMPNATCMLYYGVMKDKPHLLKFYFGVAVMIALLYLLAAALTREDQTCTMIIYGPIIAVLLLVSAGIVWRCFFIMVKVTSNTNSAPESPPAVPDSSGSLGGDKVGDDPPSYRDVVYLRSFSSPPEKSSSVFTVPMPHESYMPYSYGSLNTLPPAYHLAVSQMSNETNTSPPSDVILRPSDITLPSQVPAGNLTTLFNSSESPQSAIHVQNT
ncbi:uncharacterized protein LOC108681166 [Hyalella azteca]|uniref:Uncharacterized protein LOC108681166 n=1 Tax=Hyalella azteca TaxID=294128 RepID=A0A8B7PJK8_HYAAZ|nr:uncharacterized protein LOC108681166 [Hyalella azteca]